MSAINPYVGEATYHDEKLGKPFILELDFDALCRFEKLTGKNMPDLFRNVEEDRIDLGFADIRALFIVALRKYHPAYAKESKVGELLTIKTFEAVTQAVVAALGAAFGNPAEVIDPEAPPQPGEAGPTSDQA